MTTAPVVLKGPALWDYLRTESLNHFHTTGKWPESPSPDKLVDHAATLAATLFCTEAEYDHTPDSMMITGRLNPRWQLLDGATDATVIVKFFPYCGEMVLVMDAPIPALLNTNTFVMQWSNDWPPSTRPLHPH